MYVFALRQSCKGKALLFIPGITKRRIKVITVLFCFLFGSPPLPKTTLLIEIQLLPVPSYVTAL